MKKKIRKNLSRIMLLWTISLTSCASSLTQLPALKNRSLRIDVEKAQFLYQYQKCKRRALVFKKCWIETEYYDFNDKSMRQKLKDLGFKLKVTK